MGTNRADRFSQHGFLLLVADGPAPRIGEHSAAILAELGFGTAEIEQLASEKIVRLVKT